MRTRNWFEPRYTERARDGLAAPTGGRSQRSTSPCTMRRLIRTRQRSVASDIKEEFGFGDTGLGVALAVTYALRVWPIKRFSSRSSNSDSRT